MPAESTPDCSWTNQPRSGEWNTAAHSFSPRSCRFRPIAPAAVAECLRGRTLSFLGDSNIRDLGVAIASVLVGVAPSKAEEAIIGATRFNPRAWEARHPARAGVMTARAGRRRAVFHPTRPGLDQGSARRRLRSRAQ